MWRRQIIAERCPLSVRLRLFAVFYLGYASWYAVKTVYRQDHTTKVDNAKAPHLLVVNKHGAYMRSFWPVFIVLGLASACV